MFRRSILKLSSRRSIRKISRPGISQSIQPFLSLRKEFSTSSQQNGFPKAGSGGTPPQSKSNLPKVFLGSAVVAGAAMLVYNSGYLDQFIVKEPEHSAKVGKDNTDERQTMHLGEQGPATVTEEPGKLSYDVEQTQTQRDSPQVEVQHKAESHIDLPHVENEQKAEHYGGLPPIQVEDKDKTQTDSRHHESLTESQGGQQSYIQEISNVDKENDSVAVKKTPEPDFSRSTKAEHSPGMEDSESKTSRETSEGIQGTPVETQVKLVADKGETQTEEPQHLASEEGPKAAIEGTDVAGLLNAYHLKERTEESTATEGLGEEAHISGVDELNDGYVTKDGKLVVDFLQAIHAAEKRQAQLDAHVFALEKQALKEKYEKELRDLRARELMLAEEAAMLDKELKRERSKAAAAIRTLQEIMEEKLRTELEQKESESEMNIKKFQELAKAELAAAIASEKAGQIEKIAEANLHINALCMAFYARSEEARQIHSVHKLALGALALEDALSKGLPIHQELDALNTYLEGIDKDSLVQLVLSTLPEETRCRGTDTLLQLNQKFNALKGTLRHYILIPLGGGGILAHTMAQIASWLRFKEVDPCGDGIESVISRVEGFLAEGKLAEAANALQEGVRGSKAEEIAGDWVTQARNRAITEQALTVLQAYAACISLTQ